MLGYAQDENNNVIKIQKTRQPKMQYRQSPTKQQISLQAFIQQIENWQLTLTREQKKLKHLYNKLHSKILVNQIQILITEIDAELLQYKKVRTINGVIGDVILLYNEASKRFMEIMEAIGSFVEKVEAMAGEGLDEIDREQDMVKDFDRNHRSYKQETFTYTISKQQKSKAQSKSSLKPSAKSSINPSSKPKPQIPKKPSKCTNTSLSLSSQSPLSHTQSLALAPAGQLDSWEMRYQLKEIKSMMAQIQNQIRYHSHEDIEVELAKLQHSNKKLGLEVKSLREDSQYIITRIQKLKDELVAEKKIQARMIQEFENPNRQYQQQPPQDSRRVKGKSYSIEGSRVRASSEKEKRDMTTQNRTIDGVSDWVKVRI